MRQHLYRRGGVGHYHLRAAGRGRAPKEIVAKQRAAFRPLTEKRLATAKRVARKLGVTAGD